MKKQKKLTLSYHKANKSAGNKNRHFYIKKREKKENERKAIFDKAKKTGVKQELKRWSEECNDPNEDCDIDIIIEYAMPDGTIKTERNHTW